MQRDAAPREDEMETLWRTYYASIFNPARIKLAAMHKEMPRRYRGPQSKGRFLMTRLKQLTLGAAVAALVGVPALLSSAQAQQGHCITEVRSGQ